ncbi:hypothetical protein [Mycolicibacterium mucogenicum]|uniref:hypothetical protein n=1 Tax=Mycolicibacterium mucogenicum TaxID=56689 RepID=UPI0011B79AD5|nr:hypothetical protein [Mycolicibacterium mucogenicum]
MSFLVVSAAALLVALLAPQSTPQPAPPPKPPTSPAYTASEVNAAKVKACAAWDASAVAMTSAGNSVAQLPPSWDGPEQMKALANEARVTLVETAYMRTQVDPATPESVRSSIERYNALTFAQQDAVAHRLGTRVDKLIDEQNVVVKQLESLCAQP